MEASVRREIDTLMGHMTACRAEAADVEAGTVPGPAALDNAGFMKAMTWAKALGALQVLEGLGLISADERDRWEAEARSLVANPVAPPAT